MRINYWAQYEFSWVDGDVLLVVGIGSSGSKYLGDAWGERDGSHAVGGGEDSLRGQLDFVDLVGCGEGEDEGEGNEGRLHGI